MLPYVLRFSLLAFALFAGVLACLEIGWRVRNAGRREESPDADSGLGAIDGAVYGLMGLLIAFTFTGAAARFEVRRELITTETNAIGTAWLRIDLLPAVTQPAIRADFRDYVDSRLETLRLVRIGNAPGARAEMAHNTALQTKIWKEAVAACQQQNSAAVTSLMMSSLNDMIDITTTRYVAMLTHPPLAIYLVLAFLVLASALLGGYGMGKSGKRNWTHMLLYSAALAVAMYVILDLDYPRVGVIRVDTLDHIMVDLRNSMK
jgi:hypothetical protein